MSAVTFDGPVIELRAPYPCGKMHGKLAVHQGIIEFKCPTCTRDHGRDAYHYWDTRTGRMVDPAALRQSPGITDLPDAPPDSHALPGGSHDQLSAD